MLEYFKTHVSQGETKKVIFKESYYKTGAGAYPYKTDRLPPTLVVPKAREEQSIPYTGHPRQIWLIIVGDLLLILLANVLSNWIRFGEPVRAIMFHTWTVLTGIMLYVIFFYIFDLYNIERISRLRDILYRSALAAGFGGCSSIPILYLFAVEPFGRGLMFFEIIFVVLFLSGWRWISIRISRTAITKIPAIIIGAGDCGLAIYELLRSYYSQYDIKGFVDDDMIKVKSARNVPVLGTCAQLTEIAGRAGAKLAILAIPRNRSTELVQSVLRARLNGVAVKEMADVYEKITGRIPVQYIEDRWLLFSEGFYLIQAQYLQNIKRIMDFVASGLLLLLTLPVFAAVAVLVKLDSKGPVFYKQERVGKGDKKFTIYKFRSMRVDAEANGAQWASVNDDRTTGIGKWLRLTHLDELPQVWNVFKGDMSLVGPRPERPEFVRTLEDKIPYYYIRHSIRPGVTGWAQVNYRYGSSTEDSKRKLELDLYYVKNMSFLLDVKILLRTIGVVFLGEGSR